MPCPRCGLQNPPGTASCGRCGLGLGRGVPGQGAPGQGAPGQYGGPAQRGSGQGPVPPTGQGVASAQPQWAYGDPSATGDQTAVVGRSQEQQRQGYTGPGGSPPQYGPGGSPPYGPGGSPPYGPGPGGSSAYGAGQQSPYQGGNAVPGTGWPMTTPGSKVSSGSGPGAGASVIALGLGGVMALAYAVWAFTARRGIFADFADGSSVSTDDAKSSDTLDTVFLVLAGLVALVALGLWITRLIRGTTKGGAIDLAGIAVAGIGLLIVLVGLFLASGIADANGQSAQGDKGVTATLVTGAGFVLLAVGLLMGLMTVRGPRAGFSSSPTGGYPQQGYGNW